MTSKQYLVLGRRKAGEGQWEILGIEEKSKWSVDQWISIRQTYFAECPSIQEIRLLQVKGMGPLYRDELK